MPCLGLILGVELMITTVTVTVCTLEILSADLMVIRITESVLDAELAQLE